MTDNEIIKALECCAKDEWNCDYNCPFFEKCSKTLMAKSAFNLINQQKADIERLQDENKSIRYCYEQAKAYNDTLAESCEKNCKKFNMTTRAEAIKEFAEKLKTEMRLEDDCRYDCMNCLYECKGYVPIIDNLVKEMTEVEKMRKVFISQPMKGKSDGEIKAVREDLIKKIKERFGEVEIMDTYFENAPYDARPLWYLAKSLEALSRADIAYFAKDFDKNRGCTIEHLCAREYGITIVYEEVN